MKKNVTKKEMLFVINLIESFCKEHKKIKTLAKSETVREWEELYNAGFECCSEIILEKIEKMKKREYKF